MPTSPSSRQRRCDHETARQIQFGLSLLYRKGVEEAWQYMLGVGISSQTFARVISARNVRGAGISVRIECKSDGGEASAGPGRPGFESGRIRPLQT